MPAKAFVPVLKIIHGLTPSSIEFLSVNLLTAKLFGDCTDHRAKSDAGDPAASVQGSLKEGKEQPRGKHL